MKLSGESSSSSSQKRSGRSGLRLRKKHKRLDAICEREYNKNHGELNVGDGSENRSTSNETDVRRSSRVRRAPVFLDASPSPPKKRRKLIKNVKLSCGKNVVSPESVNQKSPDVESAGAWSSRLRSRPSRSRRVDFVVKEEKDFPSRKKRLFKDVSVNLDDRKLEADVDKRKEELDEVMTTVVRSKRPGRVKATKLFGAGQSSDTSNMNLEENMNEEVKLPSNEEQETASVFEVEIVNRDSTEIVNDEAPPIVDGEHRETSTSLQLEEVGGNGNIENAEESDILVERSDCVQEDEKENDVVLIVRDPSNQLASDVHLEGDDDVTERKTLQDEAMMKMDKAQCALDNMPDGGRIKEGRRCGLCGGGTDGKPPKKFVDENGESENETYSGTSASEEPNYDIWDGFGDEPGWVGRLLGPINDRYGIAGIWVHQHCAVWSPEVYFAGLGRLKNVRAALCRGRALKCTRCGRRGATIGCRVDRCPRTYHLPCARAEGCIFDHRKFLIACIDHRHLFQPQGNKYLAQIKKLKVRKMKLETRKQSNDALRRDVEAEEKWLENCGEDEEFLKRESKRLQRDLLRIAPEYIGGSESDSKGKFQGWESVAGLKDVIRCMKEVVILPLLYPELFDSLGLTPPRGVLLHGYPGTGKTLVVRALIGACARGDRKISYFARKGADCLGKYVGDAERQLRLLFQVAEKCQPSIIFFDEIDGLAPCRSIHQDQTHNSVVSTLLALLDGLKPRGSVVVIGATNRPDAVDPALRRPGRFDREIYFPLPSEEDRAAILSLHTQKWPKPIAGPLLKWIARRTAGFAGADLQALCMQAAINALKRNFPLHEVLSSAVDKVHKHLPLPTFSVEERDWLEAIMSSPPPCSRREAGNAANDIECSSLQIHLLPCLLRPLCNLLISLYLDDRLSVPPSVSEAALTIKNMIISLLDKKKMPLDRWWLHVDDFLQIEDVATEISPKLMHLSIIVGDDSFGDCSAFVEGVNHVNVGCDAFVKQNVITQTSLLQNASSALTDTAGFRVLVAGNSKSGQRHLASCLLNCFVGNVEIQKVDAATISQEGHGNMVQGISQLLIRCTSVRSCVLFMPRIDLWAIETKCEIIDEKESYATQIQNIEQENGSHAGEKNISEPRKDQETHRSASHCWISFLEQFESVGVRTSLMVLATSEVPLPELPHRVRGFFKDEGLSGSLLTTSNYKIPCFTVQIDDNFDHDMVINFSASKLSRDVVKQMVQVIHQRTHIQSSPCKEYRTDSMKADMDRVCDRINDGSANGFKDRTQCPSESLTKISQPPSSKGLKGKSNLLLAISSFGYQILQYPHFAELCWITSKLKEGPSADASGPWKVWPFNSCVVRPNKIEKVPSACGTGNMKTREKQGIVRGLVAVGLSAYRGVYTSVKEVSLEIRKVLELLVEEVNTRIQGGKERHEYIRVLSQVAYLEDMVNSWAYGLLSHFRLEPDSPGVEAKHVPASQGSLNYNRRCEDNQVELEDCQLTVPVERPLDPEMLKDDSQQINTQDPECCDLNNRSDRSNQHLEVRVIKASPIERSNSSAVKQLNGETLAEQAHSFVATKPSHDEIQNEDGEISRSCKSQDSENPVMDIDSRPSKQSNGFENHKGVILKEGDLHVSCDTESTQFGSSAETSSQVSCMPLLENGLKGSNVDSDAHENVMNFSNRSDVPAESTRLCLYQCCPECLRSLYGLVQKILTQEMGLHGSHWTVEDIHGVVTSLSINLASAVRKACLAEYSNEISTAHFKCGKQGFENPNPRTNEINFSERMIAPVECTSHATASERTTNHIQLKLDSKFIFRDGVLVHLDVDKDASFHCKFETLCLCSLIELIEMTKRPFD